MSRARFGLVAAVLAIALPAAAGSGDGVYVDSAHGDAVTGVDRDGSLPTGSCQQCHTTTDVANGTYSLGLFGPNDNTLCFSCHVSGTGVYRGRAAFEASAHWTSGDALWPGPYPMARDPGEEGLCLNCHTPHGSRDGAGLVPVLGYVREEALCTACHDLSGPASTNVLHQVRAPDAHPVTSAADVHAVDEGLAPMSFGSGSRHAECVDCHNPHAASAGAPLGRVARIGVVNGAAGSVPTYIEKEVSDSTPVEEYEVCFKCHSSWTNLPAGAPDLALELNPSNASFHPVEAAGKNTTSAMANSLAGGLGAPHLGTTSRITCSDCHGSDQLPTSVSAISTYTGTIAAGPHGSRSATSAAFSSAILRAPYRTSWSSNYRRGDYMLCYICHDPDPFETRSEDARSDTNFRYHGRHVRDWGGACVDCHDATHGSEGAYWASNRSYARGVGFSPTVRAIPGRAEPSWSPGRCDLACHGERHDPETY